MKIEAFDEWKHVIHEKTVKSKVSYMKARHIPFDKVRSVLRSFEFFYTLSTMTEIIWGKFPQLVRALVEIVPRID